MIKNKLIRNQLFAYVLLFMFAPLANANQQLIFACAKAINGQLRFVSSPDECNASEFLLSWNASGVAGPPGPQGVPGQQGKPGNSLHVLDKEDHDAGLFLNIYELSSVIALNERLGLWVRFSLTSGDLENLNTRLYFQGSDCTGQGWVRHPSNQWLFDIGSNRYAASSKDITDTTINYQSSASANLITLGPIFCSNSIGQQTGVFAEFIEIGEAEIGYSLPLSVPLKIAPVSP